MRTRVSLTNCLHAELEAFWPGADRVFCKIASPIALAFLERYPSPRDARGLGERRLAGLLACHGYCGGKSAAELLGRLRFASEGRADRAEEEARRTAVLSLIAALKPLVEQIRTLDSRITDAVYAHPDGQVFLSLFRDRGSTLTAAKLLSEIGDRRERYPSAEALAGDAGMCPVAKESGKHMVATSRRACNKRLRNTLATLADCSRQHNPGQQASTSGRAGAAATTRMPSASWAGPGCG